MKVRLERTLNLSAAVVSVATVLGFDPVLGALLSAAISLGLALSAGLRQSPDQDRAIARKDENLP